MKKLIILALAIILSVPVFSQQTKIRKIFYLPTRAATLGEQAKIGDHVYIASDSTEYILKVNLGRAATGTYILAQRNRYTVLNSKVISTGTVTATDKISSADTSGYRYKSSDGTWWRLFISNTGAVGTATTTAP